MVQKRSSHKVKNFIPPWGGPPLYWTTLGLRVQVYTSSATLVMSYQLVNNNDQDLVKYFRQVIDMRENEENDYHYIGHQDRLHPLLLEGLLLNTIQGLLLSFCLRVFEIYIKVTVGITKTQRILSAHKSYRYLQIL